MDDFNFLIDKKSLKKIMTDNNKSEVIFNKKDFYGRNLLMHSVNSNNLCLFKMLIKNKSINIKCKDLCGNNVMHYIVENRNIEFFKLILKIKSENDVLLLLSERNCKKENGFDILLEFQKINFLEILNASFLVKLENKLDFSIVKKTIKCNFLKVLYYLIDNNLVIKLRECNYFHDLISQDYFSKNVFNNFIRNNFKITNHDYNECLLLDIKDYDVLEKLRSYKEKCELTSLFNNKALKNKNKNNKL